MKHEQLQQIIALLETQTRSAGFSYSADLLGIAAVSLRKEIDLSGEHEDTTNSLLGKSAIMH